MGVRTRGVDPDVEKKLVDLGGGVLVEQDVLNVVEKIRAYDPNLTVQYLDPGRADALYDTPYQIMEECPDGLRRPVMGVWVLDESVLERIYACDRKRVDVLRNLDANNAAIRLQEQRRYDEEVAAVSEMVQGVLKSPKDTYKATNPVTGEEHKFTSIKKS